MNEKYQLILKGKVLEVLRPSAKCFVRVQLEPFILEFPCPESYDFHLDDQIYLKGEIIIQSIDQYEILNNK